MEKGLIAAAIVPHVPRIGIEENAPPFAKGMIDGLRDAGAALRALKPDAFVLMSAHWVSTFNWYVTGQPIHEGVCVAEEAPDLIPGSPYRYDGDPALARDIATQFREAGLPCGINESPHYTWDYASFVPLHYIDPDATVPVVTLSTVVCSNLDECVQAGRLIDRAAMAAGRKVVFLASSALSHAVVRGPEQWPTEERQALDARMIETVVAGESAPLLEALPGFARDAVAEMGGRPMAAFSGALAAMEDRSKLSGAQYGSYCQSSGSGNACLCVTRKVT